MNGNTKLEQFEQYISEMRVELEKLKHEIPAKQEETEKLASEVAEQKSII